jgi:hypothetical protein
VDRFRHPVDPMNHTCCPLVSTSELFTTAQGFAIRSPVSSTAGSRFFGSWKVGLARFELVPGSVVRYLDNGVLQRQMFSEMSGRDQVDPASLIKPEPVGLLVATSNEENPMADFVGNFLWRVGPGSRGENESQKWLDETSPRKRTRGEQDCGYSSSVE